MGLKKGLDETTNPKPSSYLGEFCECSDAYYSVATLRCEVEGHTRIALEYLQQRRVLMTKEGCRSIGGSDALTVDIITSCLKRMRNWTVLAQSVMMAEFPAHETCLAFDVFGFAERPNVTESMRTEVRNRAVRLADGIPSISSPEELAVQLLDLLPIAQYEHQTKGLPIAKAWYVAINRFKRSNRLAISHPHDAVSEALVRCVTWSPATFVVESAFSTVDRLVSSSRNYNTNREEDVFMLINLHVTFGKQDLQSLMERAQRVWSKVYAPSRRHDVKLTPRADQGRRTSCFSIIFGQTYTEMSLF